MRGFLILFILTVAAISGVYGLLIAYDDYFPFGRMRETPVVKPHEDPVRFMEKGVVPVDGGESAHRFAGNVPFTPTAAEHSLVDGKEAYATYCIFCHGKSFDGEGTVGQSFNPLPWDLKSAKIQNQGDNALFSAISYGKQRMPALATTVPVEERWAVIQYLRSVAVAPTARNRG